MDQGRISDTKPALQNFTVAEDEYLWIAATPADPTRTGHYFDIFDPKGRFWGVVTLPFRLSRGRLLVSGDRLVGETQNEDGVPFRRESPDQR